ncbi:MAG TPA: trans-aconitate 2-methyltransferase [Mycobacteriales bacterium]|nr:trans-aconitate 2-methyltransferase [Mycobacteriales bacterium]
MWDPEQYARYADERSRPFGELTSRIGARAPDVVVDLGCGVGELTATLADRWPAARVTGLDSSEEMLAAAVAVIADRDRPGLRFELGDLAGWRPAEPVDVLVSNAALQWVPGHPELLVGWVAGLAPGGWLAFQVPGNYAAPAFDLLRAQVRAPRWRGRVPDVPATRVLEPAGYLDTLAALGCRVDAWETTYLHVLSGPDPVLEWSRGTALRPVLAALSASDGARFCREYAAALREAYPPAVHGTVFPFRRIFVVAQRP